MDGSFDGEEWMTWPCRFLDFDGLLFSKLGTIQGNNGRFGFVK